MRIDGSYSIGVYQPARGRKRTGAAGGFSVGSDSRTSSRVAAYETTGLSGIESLMALQALQEPDARSRGLDHGNDVLDLLEELKVALLEGNDGGGRLDRLASLLANAPRETGDPRLDEVLAEVDLRAQVELAKRGR